MQVGNTFKITHIPIALLMAFFALNAVGQSPIFQKHFIGNTKNPPKVACIESDRYNQIYFGTNQGLFLYNGIDYQPISFPGSESAVSVTSLNIDRDDRLWIGTSSGQLFILKHGAVKPVLSKAFNESGRISAIKNCSFGTMVCTYGAGVYFIQNDTVSKHINAENGLGDDYTYDAIEHNGYVWVGTDAGISQLTFEGENVANYRTKDGLPDNIVHKIIELDSHILAIGMYDYGVAFFNTKKKVITKAIESTPWQSGPVESLVSYNDKNELWIGTANNGILCLGFKNNKIHQKALTEINGLTSNKINYLHADQEENIWIGTDKGASLFTGSTFEYIRSQEGLDGQNVFDVIEDFEGKLWIANENGVQQFFYALNGEYEWKTIVKNETDNPLQVVSLFRDRSNNIWMGTYGQGLLMYSIKTNTLQHYKTEGELANLNILDLAQDQKGRLWLATLGKGLICVIPDENNLSITQQTVELDQQSSYVYSVHIDQNEQLFYGTDGNGLGVFDCLDDYSKPLNIAELTGKTIYSIASGNDGSLWISVAEEGLKKLEGGNVKSFGLDQGIRSNLIASVHCLPNGDIVVGHDKGIDLINRSTEIAQPFNPGENGLGFDPNLNGSSIQSGSIYFGTEQGIVKFSPLQQDSNQLRPRVWIDDVRVNYNSTSGFNGASFNYDENHFIIDFQGIWMKRPESLVYSYMLEGFDKKWSFETKTLVATYSSLPSGNYTFKVKARSSNGIWSDPEQSSFSFSIGKPFWQEWWFHLTVLVIASFSVYGFIKYRTKKLIADKRQLEEEVELRTTEIRAQKNIIEHKNEEILSSITYAKRIQEAILPPESIVNEQLPESFIYYQPKDIVAGDFYWLECVNDKVIYAAADCTGHGVPGAMVSVVCSNALNRAVREYGLSAPSKILDVTKEMVVEQFQKSEEDVKDGMDIALCALDLKALKLEYSGANNPLWIVSKKGELTEIKATKQAIGKTENTKPFEHHEMQLSPGDMVYTFTDGYPDQFGGPKGKKLMYRAFKELLIEISQKPVVEQRTILGDLFHQWRGDLEQVDDVCVIGVRV